MTSNKQHPQETKVVQEAQEGGLTSTYCLVSRVLILAMFVLRMSATVRNALPSRKLRALCTQSASHFGGLSPPAITY
jgi:hypothetical protein